MNEPTTSQRIDNQVSDMLSALENDEAVYELVADCATSDSEIDPEDEDALDRLVGEEDKLRRLLAIRLARAIIGAYGLNEWELANGEVDA